MRSSLAVRPNSRFGGAGSCWGGGSFPVGSARLRGCSDRPAALSSSDARELSRPPCLAAADRQRSIRRLQASGASLGRRRTSRRNCSSVACSSRSPSSSSKTCTQRHRASLIRCLSIDADDVASGQAFRRQARTAFHARCSAALKSSTSARVRGARSRMRASTFGKSRRTGVLLVALQARTRRSCSQSKGRPSRVWYCCTNCVHADPSADEGLGETTTRRFAWILTRPPEDVSTSRSSTGCCVSHRTCTRVTSLARPHWGDQRADRMTSTASDAATRELNICPAAAAEPPAELNLVVIVGFVRS